MTLSSSQISDLNKPQNEFIYLIKCEISKLNTITNQKTEIIKIVNNNEDITIGSSLFTGVPFVTKFPNKSQSNRGSIQFIMPIFDYSIINELRGLNKGTVGKNTLIFEYDLISSQDYEESLIGTYKLYCNSYSFTETILTFTLSAEVLADVAYTLHTFNKRDYPALF